MKKIMWGCLILTALGLTALADTVLLTDDFAGTIDPAKWTIITGTGHDTFDETTAGNSVTPTSGYMWLQNLTLNGGGAYKSKLLPVDGVGKIVIDRRILLSANGSLLSMPDEVVAEDGTVLLRWGYHNYNDGAGTIRTGFGGFDDPLVSAIWSGESDEVITYDPITGQGSYSNANGTATITGVPLPAGTTNLYLRGSAYGGDSTSCWKAFQDFTVSQTDRTLLTVSSKYGSPVPNIGTNVYDTGSTVTCSAANVTIDGVTYECTGWSGTGSVPASGTTNEVIFTLSEDSSITWNWALLLEDDFDDEVLDPSKWAFITYSGSGGYNTNAVGSSITESNGFMNISQDSSAGGAYQSRMLPVNDRELIVIERRTKVGHISSSAIMSDDLMSESGTTLLHWNYYYYYSYPYGIYGFGGSQGPWVSGVWNTWFDETITYNPLTGQGSYSLNGGTPVPIAGVPLAAGQAQVYLRGSAYGADGASGYTKQFDTFKVSQVQAAQRASLRVNSAYGSPTPGSMPHDLGTVVTCSVDNIVMKDGLRYQCTGWSGTGSVPVSGTTNEVVVTLGEDSSLTWNWQVLDASLAVYTAYGNPVPAPGTHIYDFGSVVTCSVENAIIDSGTRYQCTGSFLSGPSAGYGTTNEVVAVLDANRSLTWMWEAQSYWLDINVEGQGSVNLSSGFYPAGSSQTLVATPDAGWRFEGWRDGSSGPGDAVVSVNAPKTITAVFFSPVTITNVSVAQIEGTRTVNVSYDLWAEGSALVGLEVYRNDTNLNASSFSGALGMVSPGTNQMISWNAGTDWNFNVDELTFRLLSDDGRPFYAPYSLNAPSLVPQTGQTNSYSLDGTDGDLRPGLEWPEPRFSNNGDNTVTDNMTGLMWARGQSSASWGTALANCQNLTLGGYTDWRLPNIREMRTLLSNFNYYQPTIEPNVFSLNSNYPFWTSTVYTYSPNSAYVVHSGTGEVSPYLIYQSLPYYPYQSYYTYSYLPVRGAATGPVRVAKTGQTNSFSGNTTEDGDLQLGEAWPDPRFTDHGDGTATDNLTGLMWTTNASTYATWENARTNCNGLTTGGYDDWRLPSVVELESLVDFGKKSPNALLPDGHPFVGVTSSSGYDYHYWSGTTSPGSSGSAYKVSFYNGKTYIFSKTGPGRVLACRGGVAVQSAAPPEPRAWVPLPETGQTNSYAANDDGALQAGISPPSPRFSYQNEFMFRDNLTGLCWYINMSGSDEALLNWYTSFNYINDIRTETGFLWRMPNAREMLSLMDMSQSSPALPEGHPFARVQSNAAYWTSTSKYGGLGNSYAWQVDMTKGTTTVADKGVASGFCALVYGPLGVPQVYLPKTGQTDIYENWDDGDLQRGVDETWVRFTDNGNSTISDNTTGLMWLKSPDACGLMTWAEAVQYCADLNYGGHSDWRLPNIRELESLVDYSRGGSETVLPAGHPFDEIDLSGQGHFFLSSTTLNSDSSRALALTLYQGNFATGPKYAPIKVWPVRGGK